jgi:hypothetical protein
VFGHSFVDKPAILNTRLLKGLPATRLKASWFFVDFFMPMTCTMRRANNPQEVDSVERFMAVDLSLDPKAGGWQFLTRRWIPLKRFGTTRLNFTISFDPNPSARNDDRYHARISFSDGSLSY